MSKSSVRLAFETSVAWTAPRGAAGQAPEQERVDRAERELAALGTGASAGHGVEDVRDLRPAEVRVQGQSRPLAEERLVARGPQPLARGRRDPRLPDDRVGDRLAGRAIPDDRRLALVRDADRGDPAPRRRPGARPPARPRAGSTRSPRGRGSRGRATGTAARTAAARSRPAGRRARRRSPATTSCPGRGRGSAALSPTAGRTRAGRVSRYGVDLGRLALLVPAELRRRGPRRRAARSRRRGPAAPARGASGARGRRRSTARARGGPPRRPRPGGGRRPRRAARARSSSRPRPTTSGASRP